MTTALNYCRQFRQYHNETKAKYKYPGYLEYSERILKLMDVGQKIMLPTDALIMGEATSLNALDEKQQLRLPYPVTIFELPYSPKNQVLDTVPTDKAIIITREMKDTEGGMVIGFIPIVHFPTVKRWFAFPELVIPDVGYLVRQDGQVLMNIYPSTSHFDNNTPIEMADYRSELSAFFEAMNVLTCTNVHLDKLNTPKQGKIKSALPFDSYWILTIYDKIKGCGLPLGYDRHSPREHLRRGHIRHYKDGSKTWVNAHTVSTGNGGKITKDYKL